MTELGFFRFLINLIINVNFENMLMATKDSDSFLSFKTSLILMDQRNIIKSRYLSIHSTQLSIQEKKIHIHLFDYFSINPYGLSQWCVLYVNIFCHNCDSVCVLPEFDVC